MGHLFDLSGFEFTFSVGFAPSCSFDWFLAATKKLHLFWEGNNQLEKQPPQGANGPKFT